MDRRSFLLTSVAGARAVPVAAEAQQARKVFRIGLSHVGLDHVPPSVDGLRAGLKALGYNVGTAPVAKNQAVRAPQGATSAIPVVFVHVTDPVAEGFVKTLSPSRGQSHRNVGLLRRA